MCSRAEHTRRTGEKSNACLGVVGLPSVHDRCGDQPFDRADRTVVPIWPVSPRPRALTANHLGWEANPLDPGRPSREFQ
jgi:hypothetical protein